MTDYASSAERFAADTKNHQIEILHDEGLYRHVRFVKPNTGLGWFELATWPGKLAIVGDFGDGFVFSRESDMFGFFRVSRDINPGYWAEKVTDGRDRCKGYSEGRVRELIKDAVAEYAERCDDLIGRYEADMGAHQTILAAGGRSLHPGRRPKSVAEVRQILADHEADDLTADEDDARELLRELEQARVASNTWEWDLRDWTWEFLWACRAIHWGVAAYDATKAGKSIERPAAPAEAAAEDSAPPAVVTLQVAGDRL